MTEWIAVKPTKNLKELVLLRQSRYDQAIKLQNESKVSMNDETAICEDCGKVVVRYGELIISQCGHCQWNSIGKLHFGTIFWFNDTFAQIIWKQTIVYASQPQNDCVIPSSRPVTLIGIIDNSCEVYSSRTAIIKLRQNEINSQPCLLVATRVSWLRALAP
jgi:ribosomal protein L37AE/L43A